MTKSRDFQRIIPVFMQICYCQQPGFLILLRSHCVPLSPVSVDATSTSDVCLASDASFFSPMMLSLSPGEKQERYLHRHCTESLGECMWCDKCQLGSPTAQLPTQLSSTLVCLLIAVHFVPVRVNQEHRSSVKYHGSQYILILIPQPTVAAVKYMAIIS